MDLLLPVALPAPVFGSRTIHGRVSALSILFETLALCSSPYPFPYDSVGHGSGVV